MPQTKVESPPTDRKVGSTCWIVNGVAADEHGDLLEQMIAVPSCCKNFSSQRLGELKKRICNVPKVVVRFLRYQAKHMAIAFLYVSISVLWSCCDPSRVTILSPKHHEHPAEYQARASRTRGIHAGGKLRAGSST